MGVHRWSECAFKIYQQCLYIVWPQGPYIFSPQLSPLQESKSIKIMPVFRNGWDEWLSNLIFELPFLEYIHIDHRMNLRSIKISSGSFKKLFFRSCDMLDEFKLDIPSLRIFKYHGNLVLFSCLNNPWSSNPFSIIHLKVLKKQCSWRCDYTKRIAGNLMSSIRLCQVDELFNLWISKSFPCKTGGWFALDFTTCRELINKVWSILLGVHAFFPGTLYFSIIRIIHLIHIVKMEILYQFLMSWKSLMRS